VTATLPSNLPSSHKPGKGPRRRACGACGHIPFGIRDGRETTGHPSYPGVISYSRRLFRRHPGIREPELKRNIGKSIVTSDGTTLLGADDKAGCAIIMTAIQTLIGSPNLMHGDIRVCIHAGRGGGAGTKFFDQKSFGADFAYTVDGDTPGELNKETFSADLAVITVHGRNIHPGSAKNIMVNSIRAMADIVSRMPRDTAPETTEGYEPYIHPHIIEGKRRARRSRSCSVTSTRPGLMC